MGKSAMGRPLQRRIVLILGLLLLITTPLEGRNRRKAREAFQRALEYHQKVLARPLEDRTRGQYDRAVYLYRLVLDHDPTYGGCDDALFAIASIYEERFERFKGERSRQQAIHFYEFLAREYPRTKFRREARQRAQTLRSPPPPPEPEPLPPPVRSGPLATVTEIRYWSNEDYTRVVIQLDRETEFLKEVLSNPDRIYFDLQNARLESELERAYDVNGVSLERVRVGENQPGVVRVVLDFENIFRHSVFALYDPFRIVIDTRGPQAGAGVPDQTVKTATAVINLEDGPSKREVTTERPVAPSPNLRGELSLTRVLGLKIGRVALDPGHGGRDSGTVGPNGLKEKDLVLDVSLRVKELLEQRLGTEVILTREEDEFIPLEERTAIANKEGADLFISIHANASRNRRVSGIETYFLSIAPSADEREVASRENATSQRNIRELEDLLRKIAQGDYYEESQDLAHVVQKSMAETLQAVRPHWRNRGVKKAPFIVLINSTMPSILTEIGFISNPSDAKYLTEDEARDQVAEALYKGIEDYFRALGSAPAEAAETESARR